MLLHIDASWLISLAVLTLLLVSGFALMFKGKLPRDLVPMLISLIVGPCVVTLIIRLLLAELATSWPRSLGGPPLLLVILVLVLMTASFLYVRGKVVGTQKTRELQGHTNERQMMLPANYNEGIEAGARGERDQTSSEDLAPED